MATTFTQADLDALDQAIGLGARTVAFADGKRVVYRSLDEMREARRYVAECLAGGQGAPVRKVIAHSKGVRPGPEAPYDWRY